MWGDYWEIRIFFLTSTPLPFVAIYHIPLFNHLYHFSFIIHLPFTTYIIFRSSCISLSPLTSFFIHHTSPFHHSHHFPTNYIIPSSYLVTSSKFFHFPFPSPFILSALPSFYNQRPLSPHLNFLVLTYLKIIFLYKKYQLEKNVPMFHMCFLSLTYIHYRSIKNFASLASVVCACLVSYNI